MEAFAVMHLMFLQVVLFLAILTVTPHWDY